MINREQFEKQLKEQEKGIANALVRAGVPLSQARSLAKKQIEKAGSTKTVRGECPLGATSPMGCMLCQYGHMTECHYPLSCKESECSHYRAEMEAEHQYDYPEDEPL